MRCEDIQRLAVFYACDELNPADRTAVDEHVKGCPACAAVLERERRLLEAVAASEPPWKQLDPSSLLLARCRDELEEALDHLPARRQPWRLLVDAFRPATWLTVHPAWSAAVLVLVGVALGQLIPQWFRQQPPAVLPRPAMNVSPLADRDLQNVGISGITWLPGSDPSAPSVEVHMTAASPLVVRGTALDHDIKRVLMYVVQNNQRFDPGVRLDSVEVLQTRSEDAEIRQALCQAARNDQNPAVRLGALEALRGFEQDESVREALLEALLHDRNPGVRVEAINALRALADKTIAAPDEQVIRVLRDRMQNDPNTYIRLQSAAAIRQLGPREIQ